MFYLSLLALIYDSYIFRYLVYRFIYFYLALGSTNMSNRPTHLTITYGTDSLPPAFYPFCLEIPKLAHWAIHPSSFSQLPKSTFHPKLFSLLQKEVLLSSLLPSQSCQDFSCYSQTEEDVTNSQCIPVVILLSVLPFSCREMAPLSDSSQNTEHHLYLSLNPPSPTMLNH